MRKLAKHLEDLLDVEFTAIGEHAGDGSATLSSFLGVLVRETVPVLIHDWRHVPNDIRDMLWEEIQVHFEHSYFTFYLRCILLFKIENNCR